MAWIAVDAALAVIGVAVLAVLGFQLWRRVQLLGREVSAASQRLGTAAGALEAATAEPGSRVPAVDAGRLGVP